MFFAPRYVVASCQPSDEQADGAPRTDFAVITKPRACEPTRVARGVSMASTSARGLKTIAPS